jgi:hypothetical protein
MIGKNTAASVKARLHNVAVQLNKASDLIFLLFAHERFLYRLAQSTYRDDFILKGGLFLYSLTKFQTRPTRDADFLLSNLANQKHRIIEIFREIMSIEVDDGLRFDLENITTETIVEEQDEPGIRVNLDAYLERTRCRLQFDIGFSDVVIPSPRDFDYPELLDGLFGTPNIRVYSLESVIAEKFAAMLKLSVMNSRMKDFFDIYMISSHWDCEGRVLQEAVKQTIERRLGHLERLPVVFEHAFVNHQKTSQWNAFLSRSGLGMLEFEKVMERIRIFLRPIYDAIVSEDEFFKNWDCKIADWK